jgi:hypothetical protein
MVEDPADYPWSGAAAHCSDNHPGAALDIQLWRQTWTPAAWRDYLDAAGAVEEADAIRRNTHTGRPLGAADFVAALEKTMGRRLMPEKGGRPPKQEHGVRQQAFGFGQT